MIAMVTPPITIPMKVPSEILVSGSIGGSELSVDLLFGKGPVVNFLVVLVSEMD